MEISRIAAEYGLSTYDAAYLELAARLACPLATQDVARRPSRQTPAPFSRYWALTTRFLPCAFAW